MFALCRCRYTYTVSKYSFKFVDGNECSILDQAVRLAWPIVAPNTAQSEDAGAGKKDKGFGFRCLKLCHDFLVQIYSNLPQKIITR